MAEELLVWCFAAVKMKIIFKIIETFLGVKINIVEPQIEMLSYFRLLQIFILTPKLFSTHFLKYLHQLRFEENKS